MSREEGFCGDEDAHDSHNWDEPDPDEAEEDWKKFWCPGVKAHPSTMIGRGEPHLDHR